MPDSATYVPTRADEINAIGADFFRKGLLEPARLHFLGALSLEPQHSQALQNMGAVLRQMGHYEASASMARRSVIASGNNPYCRSNLGVAQLAMRDYAGALATLLSVARDLPDAGPSWHNYGLVLYMTGCYAMALLAFDKSLELEPDNSQVLSDKALTLLSLGHIQEGLAVYEVRWNLLYRNKIWNMNLPEWQGEGLSGRRILMHHEQGFGDSIMLSRFCKQLQAKGAEVTMVVPAELVKLFARSFVDVNVVDMDELAHADGFDYHSPMLSALRWLGIESPDEISSEPYLKAETNPAIRLPEAKTKIGICWASGNHSPEMWERRRVVPLTKFLPLSELPNVALISLQKGPGSNDIENNGMEGIVFDISAKLEDFAATADVIAQLDVVISVDSAVAHLAGAMGKPVMMLSPYTRCWRWWNENGMPWYGGMQQYAQSQDGTWDKAMSVVRQDFTWLVD